MFWEYMNLQDMVFLKKGSSRHWEILRMQRTHPSWRTVTPTLKELYRYLETHNPGEYAKP